MVKIAQTREVIRERQTSVGEDTRVSSWNFNRFVFYLAGVIETLLLFRFTLKILRANPGSPFVSFIYSLSGIFESPFRGIFRTVATEGIETVSVLEPSTISALLVYSVIAIGVTQLVNVLTESWD